MESSESSDDEIFFGPITLREIKLRFGVPVGKSHKNENITINKDAGICEENPDKSFCLLTSHSQPNLRPKPDNPCTPSKLGPITGKSDDSFIQMDNMVSEQYMSPRTSDSWEFNNTLDVMNYILNHPPNKEESPKQNNSKSSSAENNSVEQHTHVMESAFEDICQLQSTSQRIKQTNEEIPQLQPTKQPGIIQTNEEICQPTNQPGIMQTNEEIPQLQPKNPPGIERTNEEIHRLQQINQLGIKQTNEEIHQLQQINQPGLIQTNEEIHQLQQINQPGIKQTSEEIRQLQPTNQPDIIQTNDEIRQPTNQPGIIQTNEKISQPTNQRGIKQTNDEIHKLQQTNQSSIKQTNEEIHQLHQTKQSDIKQTSEEIRQLQPTNQSGIKQTNDEIHQLPSTNQSHIRQTSEEIRQLQPTNQSDIKQTNDEIHQLPSTNQSDIKQASEEICQLQPTTNEKIIKTKNLQSKITTKKEHAKLPVKIKVDRIKSSEHFTQDKNLTKEPQILALTPQSKTKTQLFRTPPNPSAITKYATPYKNVFYKHIASPVAAYIKKCPQVALVTNVRPKIPLPGMSGIPRLVNSRSKENLEMDKNTVQSRSQENLEMYKNKVKTRSEENLEVDQNKVKYRSEENLEMDKNNMAYNLPSVAYKSAKKTEVIQVPDKNKLPQSQWVKKMTASFPKPTVMKHEKRIYPEKKKLPSIEDNSFSNLSCCQADVSICTEKTAFKTTN